MHLFKIFKIFIIKYNKKMVFDIHHDKLFKFYIFILAILNINSYQFFKAYPKMKILFLFIKLILINNKHI